ncbi:MULTISPECIES: adenosylcobinamide-GDP ribazoletransferase [unclassified Rhizobium]|uniref:adenosylcobinamide-GDP ribazoletransferase n=2 Tax=unclassified Rhizobium TaxID=2613769 RepID=UPI001ADD07C0|nr:MULTISPECIES: adenosylcobinamide-GDP ribazoletransferase [unclassified Rhizobium]MBO9098652.1 adenosylcobinamide-GDP ribazoletransferase [Rhizobium sp. L58/93]MBO9168918.1 adenosylcobinamide-GDP ribazoletransferase [Rhizobium sp. L245/93]MBO9184868.1 adenosylcobinamide-GDP ribazoletransferase [Rhizobium sp. E27B/91]QXZ85780.1 adenosylcobinamide-GDP ribazoletransferase [Rhizobium sp. K1/93]QXZ97855.1 adenosylcobinamide-GDP ribazoletransferase [Rhizobium sp. B230/85]QYA03381.1 adenosylcobina
MTAYAADIARAIGFLSRIRMPDAVFHGHDGNLGQVARAFPIAGALIALPAALLFGVLAAGDVDPLLAALLALGLQTLLSGALHEDGLSDTADGLGGGRDATRALAIMKDSRIGTYGAVALILSFALRAAALAAIARGLHPLAAALTLPATAALSRAALVWHWHRLPVARPDGVAAAAGQPDREATLVAVVSGLLLGALLLWQSLTTIALLDVIGLGVVATLAFTAYVRRRLSGHTGDTIGATQQICEIAVLCALAMAV